MHQSRNIAENEIVPLMEMVEVIHLKSFWQAKQHGELRIVRENSSYFTNDINDDNFVPNIDLLGSEIVGQSLRIAKQRNGDGEILKAFAINKNKYYISLNSMRINIDKLERDLGKCLYWLRLHISTIEFFCSIADDLIEKNISKA